MHVAVGLVDQVEVEIVQLQALQRLVDGVTGALVSRVLDPQLGSDEQVLALNTAVPDALADRLFVHVRGRGVDQAVAGLDCVDDGALALLRIGDLEYPESEDGHLEAIIQRHVLHVWFPFMLVRVDISNFTRTGIP
jgi:hypothetical protein